MHLHQQDWAELAQSLVSSRLQKTHTPLETLAACALYLYAAIGPVYGTRGGVRVMQAAVLAFGVGAIVLGYRFALFLITLYGT